MTQTLLDKIGSRVEWARSALLTAGAQAAVQLLAFAAGILVIRSLDPEQYAYYTIANTALGAMAALTNSGIVGGVTAEGGKVWTDRERLGTVIAAGLEIRTRFALLAALLSVPAMLLLLHRHGAGVVEAVIIAVSVLPTFFTSITNQLLEIAPRLHQSLGRLQLLQVGANLARIATLAVVVRWWPLAAAASLSAALPQIWANWRLRRLSAEYASWHAPRDVEARRRILAQANRTLPALLYYTLSGQLAVWLISIFGRTESVAAIGALGRLAMVLGALGVVFNILAIPRYARIPAHERARLFRRYWQAQALLIGICALPLVALFAFPDAALALLGPNYAGLGHEAALMAVSSVMAILVGAAFGLGAARGVVAPPLFAVSFGIILQAVLILILPIDTLAGAIWLGILSETGLWLLHVAYFLRTASRASASTAHIGPS